MEFIKTILQDPTADILIFLAFVYAAKELLTNLDWWKNRVDKHYEDKSTQKEEKKSLEKRVCDIACTSDKHTQTLAEIGTALNGINNRLDNLEAITTKDKAIQSRRRILRFADECRREERHSQEHFNEVIEGDIKSYTEYCRNHKDFENDKCVMSIQFIRDAYKHCLDENDFL